MYKIATMIDSLADRLESMGFIKEAHDLDVIANTVEAFLTGSYADVDGKRIMLDYNNQKKTFELKFPDLRGIAAFTPLPIPGDESVAKEVFDQAKIEAKTTADVPKLYVKMEKFIKSLSKGVPHVQ